MAGDWMLDPPDEGPPCPECGSLNVTIEDDSDPDGRSYLIDCHDCDNGVGLSTPPAIICEDGWCRAEATLLIQDEGFFCGLHAVPLRKHDTHAVRPLRF